MAVTFPTTFDVREARDQAQQAVSEAVGPLRAPSLAVLGLGDVAVATAREAATRVQSGVGEAQAQLEELPAEIAELRSKLTAEEFRRLVESYLAAVRSVYSDLVRRGEGAYSQLKAQPQVRRALDRVDAASSQVEGRLEGVVEGVRSRGESTLAGVSTQTRSVGERAARATQRVSGRAAEVAAEAGSEAAEGIEAAGEQVASQTRSASRKAASRTAPEPKKAATSGGARHAPK